MRLPPQGFPPMDNRKYIIMAFVAVAGLVGMAARGLSIPMLALLEIGDPMVLGMTGTGVLGMVSGIFTFLALNRNQQAYAFADDVVTELRKVTWPDKDETIRSTSVVLGFALTMAVTITLYDLVWGRLTKMFLFTDG